MRHEHDGGGRRPRFFGHGDLRLVILDILTRNASHGYELIKEIENLTQGHYTPSPGVIYPTLDYLQDQALITITEEENGRKRIAINAAGEQWLEITGNSWSRSRRVSRRAPSVSSCAKPADEAGAG